MAINSKITSFNSGLHTPLLDARIDLDKHRNGCQELENFTITPYGGIEKDVGTKYITDAIDQTGECRLVTFQPDAGDSYILEFSDKTLTIYKDEKKLTNNYTFYDALATYDTSDKAWFEGKYYRCISDSTTGVDPDLLTDWELFAFTYSSSFETPFLKSELKDLRYTETLNDIMYFQHPNHPTQKLSRIQINPANFLWEQVVYSAGAFEDLSSREIDVAPSLTKWNSTDTFTTGDFVVKQGSSKTVNGTVDLVFNKRVRSNNISNLQNLGNYADFSGGGSNVISWDTGIHFDDTAGLKKSLVFDKIWKDDSADADATYLQLNHHVGSSYITIDKTGDVTGGRLYVAPSSTGISAGAYWDISTGDVTYSPEKTAIDALLTNGRWVTCQYNFIIIEVEGSAPVDYTMLIQVFYNGNWYMTIEDTLSGLGYSGAVLAGVQTYDTDMPTDGQARNLTLWNIWKLPPQTYSNVHRILFCGLGSPKDTSHYKLEEDVTGGGDIVYYGGEYGLKTYFDDYYEHKYTTSASHGYSVGDRVNITTVINGVTYNIETDITTVPTVTTFTVNNYAIYKPIQPPTGDGGVYFEWENDMSGTVSSGSCFDVAETFYQAIQDSTNKDPATEVDYWEDTTYYGGDCNILFSQDVRDFLFTGGVLELRQTFDNANVTGTLTANGATDVFPFSCTMSYVSHGIYGGDISVEESVDYGKTWETVVSHHSDVDQPSNKTAELTPSSDRSLIRIKLANKTTPTGNTDYKYSLTYTQSYHTAYITVNNLINKTLAECTVENYLINNKTTTKWGAPMWSDSKGYPKDIAILDGRLVLAGSFTYPSTVWGSKVDDFENMKVGTLDTDAFLLTGNIPNIKWILSQDVIIIGTDSELWTLEPDDQNKTLSGINFTFRKRNTYGSSDNKAILANDAILFSTRNANKIREASYNFSTDKWIAPDLTRLSGNILKEGIKYSAYQRIPNPIIWYLTKENNLYGLTYERDDEIIGWHKHDVTGLTIESITVANSDDGDQLWLSGLRNGYQVIERYYEEDKYDSKAWNYVDSAEFLDSSVIRIGVGGTFDSSIVTAEGKIGFYVTENINMPQYVILRGTNDIDDDYFIIDGEYQFASSTDFPDVSGYDRYIIQDETGNDVFYEYKNLGNSPYIEVILSDRQKAGGVIFRREEYVAGTGFNEVSGYHWGTTAIFGDGCVSDDGERLIRFVEHAKDTTNEDAIALYMYDKDGDGDWQLTLKEISFEENQQLGTTGYYFALPIMSIDHAIFYGTDNTKIAVIVKGFFSTTADLDNYSDDFEDIDYRSAIVLMSYAPTTWSIDDVIFTPVKHDVSYAHEYLNHFTSCAIDSTGTKMLVEYNYQPQNFNKPTQQMIEYEYVDSAWSIKTTHYNETSELYVSFVTLHVNDDLTEITRITASEQAQGYNVDPIYRKYKKVGDDYLSEKTIDTSTLFDITFYFIPLSLGSSTINGDFLYIYQPYFDSLMEEVYHYLFIYKIIPTGLEFVAYETVTTLDEDDILKLYNTKFKGSLFFGHEPDGVNKSNVEEYNINIPFVDSIPSANLLRFSGKTIIIDYLDGTYDSEFYFTGDLDINRTSRYRVGLAKESKVIPNSIEINPQSGISANLTKNINTVALNLYNSKGGSIVDVDGEEDLIIYDDSDIFTGHVEKNIQSDSKRDYVLVVTQNEPYPFTIRSIIYELNVGG